MNPRSTPSVRFMIVRRRLLVSMLAAGIGQPLSGPAQVRPASTPALRPAEKPGPIVELSPFVITAETEAGWTATETLAGSRLRTNFKDVPNQIETLTREFMQDLAINTLEDGLSYSANAENGNDYLANQLKPNNSSRLRGIGTGTMTRNFFPVHNPTDNFNLERATVASGPNAILFGLGSPAGILDATTARARMRNRYGFEVQYDSADTKRGTFDVNRVIAPGLLALRLMGLSKRELTAKQPNLDRDERLYGTLTFTPFKTTTLTLDWERAHRNINRASRRAPNDFVTLWLNADRIAGSGYTSARPIFNNNNLATIATNRIFSQAPDAPLYISGGGSIPVQNWRNSVFAKNPVTLPGVDPVFDAAVNHTLLDPAVFPFDVNLLGTARTTLLGANTKTAVLEQKLAPDLFLEVAYQHEKAYDHRITGANYGNQVDVDLNVDANQFLPGSTTPNPNVGKYFVQGGTASSLEFYRRDDVRATLSYEQDLARKFSGWARRLGRHRLLGLYTESRAEYRGQQNFQRRILEEPVIPGVALRARTFQNWASHASRVMQFRQYLDSPATTIGSPGPMTGDWSMTDANGRPYSLYLFDTPLRAADGKRLGGGQVPEGTRDRNSAHVLAWQGFFLPDREKQDRLVLTYGYRKDRARNAGLDAASVQQDFSGLFPLLWDTTFTPYGEAQTGINRNLGVVTRPLKWLTLFYNRSSTFDINLGTYDPFGNPIPGAGARALTGASGSICGRTGSACASTGMKTRSAPSALPDRSIRFATSSSILRIAS